MLFKDKIGSRNVRNELIKTISNLDTPVPDFGPTHIFLPNVEA